MHATQSVLQPQLATVGSGGLLFAILEGSPFRICVCDRDRRCVLQNEISLRDFGSLVGRLSRDFPWPDDEIHRWNKQIQRALAGDTVWSESELLVRGKKRNYRRIVAPIRTGATIRSAVIVDIDVTEQRHAEATLRQREAELAHLDRLSTMGQMSSELAHELSQPLYAIANFADAGLRLLDQPEQSSRGELRKWLEQIGQQARRGGNVLKRITQFVRKGELRRQPIDLNECVRNVAAMLEHEIRRQAVELRLELLKGRAMVLADPLLIEQVLVNLIRNAVEAMEAKPGDERSLLIRTFAEGPGLCGASVSDSGPGLPADAVSQLFESYFTTKAHGTGLGLAICRSTIEAHEGTIWASNNPEGGATFQFVLPAAHQSAPSAPPE